jgi:uncharacterized protein (TIGR02594 family)
MVFGSILKFFKKSHNTADPGLLKEVVKEATKWVGVHETKGRPGEAVNVFRKATDGMAEGEPWCAAFVQYCVSAVSIRYGVEIALHPSELCYSMWLNTPKQFRLEEPLPGSIVIWNYPGTTKGHTGIVLSRLDKPNFIKTIEGNTRDPRAGADQGVRGVFPKIRCLKGSEDMVILGFLNPFMPR